MQYDGNEAHLSDYLPGVVQLYQSSFREYWGLDASAPPEGLDGKTWEWFKLWDKVALEMYGAASALQGQPRTGWLSEFTFQDVTKLLQADGLEETRKFVEQRIEVELAESFQWELEVMRIRTLDLLQWLVAVKGPVARAYLSRVADCYIKGLRVETVIMCGASLEAALDDLTDDDAIRKKLNHHGRYIPVSQRVKFLRKEGLLSPAIAEEATAILKLRNDAVHLRMDVVPQADEVVRSLAVVLEALTEGNFEVNG